MGAWQRPTPTLVANLGIGRASSVVTRNVEDFKPSGVSLINPFTRHPAQS
ncbi:MAG: hypothetical protein ABI885_03390 [Gammaproteobacteria bacterium]